MYQEYQAKTWEKQARDAIIKPLTLGDLQITTQQFQHMALAMARSTRMLSDVVFKGRCRVVMAWRYHDE